MAPLLQPELQPPAPPLLPSLFPLPVLLVLLPRGPRASAASRASPPPATVLCSRPPALRPRLRLLNPPLGARRILLSAPAQPAQVLVAALRRPAAAHRAQELCQQPRPSLRVGEARSTPDFCFSKSVFWLHRTPMQLKRWPQKYGCRMADVCRHDRAKTAPS